MKVFLKKSNYDSLLRAFFTIFCIALNFVLSFIAFRTGFPIYFDTAGTIAAATIGGIFPGIMTAVMSNVFGAIFNHETIYFGFINAFIAMFTAWYARERSFKSFKAVTKYVLITGISAGLISGLLQWGAFGKPQLASVVSFIDVVSGATGINEVIAFLSLNILLNLVDKILCFFIAMLIRHIIPENIAIRIRNSGWKQHPLSVDEAKNLKSVSGNLKKTVKARMGFMLLGCSLALTFIMCCVGINLYYERYKEEKAETARHAAEFAASVVDADMIDEYIQYGEDARGYKETEDMLTKIRDNAQGVKYLYVVQVRNEGYYWAFDLDTDDEEGYSPGLFTELEEEFEPYRDKLLAGEEIDTVEKNSVYGWVLTAYYPIRDANGICRAYAGADVSLTYMTGYMWDFLLRVIFIMAGFFILILAYGLWVAGTNLVYPINSIEKSVEMFIEAGDDQRKLDDAVRKMRSIDVRTGDEVEKLYRIVCEMAMEQTEKIRSVRRLSDETLKMQEGLIITMADLVENRDSDTGAHVQKTSEYVRIIIEGLKRKGYYAEKISPKFASDVVTSAPLHDIGKINISDKILNKPGKLTPEEYEIIKTHTVIGRNIIEKAINTVQGENYLKEARNMAAYHHERWDGKGYPDGLHGEVIPLSARIMAVADVFDALSSKRVYKPALSVEEALSLIREGAGTQFDPKCVEVFVESVPEIKVVIGKYNRGGNV